MMKIPVLVGPTSSGKTGIALEYCKHTGASIISADSRQIFKYMDIGTGKVPLGTDVKIVKGDECWEIDGVKIYGYDLVAPDQYFSGYDFAKYALATMRALILANEKVIIVGGTGFFIDLLTGRQKLNSAAPDFEMRAQLETQTLEELLALLVQHDKQSFDAIDKQNKVRVLRAVEKALSQKQNVTLDLLADVEYKFVGLTALREYLYSRADTWVDTVFAQGLLGEVQFLAEIFPGNPKLDGLVYKTALELLKGTLSEQEAIQRIKWDIHAYIRRQQTWFKKNTDITWLNIAEISKKDCIITLENC